MLGIHKMKTIRVWLLIFAKLNQTNTTVVFIYVQGRIFIYKKYIFEEIPFVKITLFEEMQSWINNLIPGSTFLKNTTLFEEITFLHSWKNTFFEIYIYVWRNTFVKKYSFKKYLRKYVIVKINFGRHTLLQIIWILLSWSIYIY